VHLFYLIGFQNRLIVLIRWAFKFFAPRDAGLITNEFQPADAPDAVSRIPARSAHQDTRRHEAA
jgi:hypothetical protein